MLTSGDNDDPHCLDPDCVGVASFLTLFLRMVNRRRVGSGGFFPGYRFSPLYPIVLLQLSQLLPLNPSEVTYDAQPCSLFSSTHSFRPVLLRWALSSSQQKRPERGEPVSTTQPP